MVSLERRLRIVVVGCAVLLAGNDALPYLGLRDDSCQTMFSALHWDERRNNHLFVPQRAVSDLWAYLVVTDVAIEPPPGSEREALVAEWLTRPGRLRNTEALRVAVRTLCDGGHRVGMTVHRSDLDDPVVRHEDACAVSALSRPNALLPVRVYETDVPAGDFVQ